MESATLRDLAKHLDLSVSTVSRILNGKGAFSEATRERVFEAAKKLHYSPNVYARELRTQEYHAVGLILPTVVNPYYGQILESVEAECSKIGYTVLIGVSNYSYEREREYIDYFMDNRVSGMILASHDSGSDILRMQSRGLRVISLNEHHPEHFNDWVSINNRKAASDLTQYLINQGHRDIACLYGNAYAEDINITAKMRLEGFLDCMRANELEVEENKILWGGLSFADGKTAAAQLICSQKMPTAIVCHNNDVAAGAYSAMSEAGFRVPEDVSIVCFDSVVPESMLAKRFTCILQPVEEMGRRAVRLIVSDSYEGGSREQPHHVRLPYRLMVGETSAKRG